MTANTDVKLFLDALILLFISVFVLYGFSKQMKLQRQDIFTAAKASTVGFSLIVFLLYFFSGTSARLIGFVSLTALVRLLYGCSWWKSFDVVVRTVFVSFLLYVPFILVESWLSV